MTVDQEVTSSMNVAKILTDDESIGSSSASSNGVNDLEDGDDSSSVSEMEDNSNQINSENNESKSKEIENLEAMLPDNIPDETSSEDESEDDVSEKESEHETSSDEEMEKENSLKSVTEKHDEEKSGWADAMAKVLKMGTNTEKAEPNKPLFLSKAIKDSEIKHRTSANTKENIEENNEEGTISEQKSQVRASIRRAQKKEMEEKGRCKPDITKDRAREKMLCKLATKGVVQLFNAVREQQKTIKTQLNTAGGSVRKREKVYKNMDRQTFLNVLSNQGGINSTPENSLKQLPNSSQLSKKPKLQMSHNVIKPEVLAKEEIKDESIGLEESGENESTWNVFRDDFMMGAKMKDWDKEDSDSDG